MATVDSRRLLQSLWREKKDLLDLKSEERSTAQSSQFIEQLVDATYAGATQNAVFLKYLKDGLMLQIFPPVEVIKGITNLSLGKKLKCYTSSLDIITSSADLLRNTSSSTAPELCKTVSQATFWLLENTIEIYKLLYECMIDPTLTSPEPDLCVQVIQKSQCVLNKLICDEEFEDLNYVGKLLFGEDEVSTLQMQMRDLLAFQLDKILSHLFYGSFETLLKEFMKLITRFLNASSTSVFASSDKSTAISPSYSLHTFFQFQVLVYTSNSSTKMAALFNNFLKFENVTMEQLFLDLYRFSVNNVLIRKNSFEVNSFTAFMFLKLPSIFANLSQQYSQANNVNILFSVLQQISQLQHNDIDITLGCNSYKNFVDRCVAVSGIDVTQAESLLMQHKSKEEASDNSLLKVYSAMQKCEEILKTLSLSPEDNREKIVQEFQLILNMADLLLILTVFAITDTLPQLIKSLSIINEFSERPKDPNDSHADLRADLFNYSFLLLCYIEAVFGEKVYMELPDGCRKCFYLDWCKRCTSAKSRKIYTQAVFDKIMEPMVQSHNLPTRQAKWDEYCWSAGMIVKELTQAHLRRQFTTDALQKVCEGFKNKRPALCICAMVWLCTQYKTMPQSERIRTAKIINLFKRPHPNPSRAAIWTRILQKYSQPLETDLIAVNSKNKNVVTEQYEPDESKLQNLLNTRNLSFDTVLLNKIKDIYKSMGVKTFAEAIIMFILDSGKEEDAVFYESICTCLMLLKPEEILNEIFLHTLKNLFYNTNTAKLFGEPQGLHLRRCLSKAFASSIALFSKEESEETPRPAKIAKIDYVPVSERENLINAFSTFLQYAVPILIKREQNAVSLFVTHLIEQIAVGISTQKQRIKIKDEIVSDILTQLPGSIGRDTIIMLCDLSCTDGQEMAAKFLLKHSC